MGHKIVIIPSDLSFFVVVVYLEYQGLVTSAEVTEDFSSDESNMFPGKLHFCIIVGFQETRKT